MKDEIKSKKGDVINVWLKQENKNLTEPSLIRCDEINYIHNKQGEFFDHHLMFYLDGKLVFKMWLRNEPEDKPFKGIHEALKSVGIRIHM